MIGVPAAIVLVAVAGAMVLEAAAMARRAPEIAARIAALDAAAKQDAAGVAALEEELERQTQTKLQRDARRRVQTGTVIVSAVLFLLCAKWLLALRDPALPRQDRIDAVKRPAAIGAGRGPDAQKARWAAWLRASPARAVAAAATATAATADDDERRGGAAASGTAAPAMQDAIDLGFIDQIVQQHGRGKESTIPALHAMQKQYRYVPAAGMERLCALTEITPAQITGVVSFYNQFRQQPIGDHLVRVCHGTACHVAGAPLMTEEIRRQLGIDPGQDTDPAGRFTIEEVACLGCCTLAPVMRIDDTTRGHLTTDQIEGLLAEDSAVRRNGHSGAGRARATRRLAHAENIGAPVGELRIGLGSCCVAGGSAKVYDALQEAITAAGVHVTVKRVGCVGMCHQTPLIEAVLPGCAPVLYTRVAPAAARAIVARHFRPRSLSRRIRNRLGAAVESVRAGAQDPPVDCHATEPRDPHVTAFLSRQKLIATEHSGELDPTDLNEYLRHDGFEALRRCVRELDGEQVIDIIDRSGLRGRGGGGFPSGRKWAAVRAAKGERKFVVCNGDEGDPGAFMDRMLMESYPYRILEGLAIAAHAAGASEGYLYIRAEYPLAVERIREAIRKCQERGFLGRNILGTSFALQLEVMEGAGAFICGEETALINSIEGHRGTPHLRPPYPVDHGLWGQPTLINKMSRHSPPSRGSFAMAPKPSPRWERPPAEGPRSFPWPVRSAAAA